MIGGGHRILISHLSFSISDFPFSQWPRLKGVDLLKQMENEKWKMTNDH